MAKTVLVVANETLGGRPLLAKIKELAAQQEIRVVVCVPRTNPRQGNIIYDEAVFDAAQVRIDLARKILREEGIENAIGEVGDPDPFTAVMNAVQFFRVDDIVISTLPATRSGWLRADLIERVRRASNKPVEHVVAESADAVA